MIGCACVDSAYVRNIWLSMPIMQLYIRGEQFIYSGKLVYLWLSKKDDHTLETSIAVKKLVLKIIYGYLIDIDTQNICIHTIITLGRLTLYVVSCDFVLCHLILIYKVYSLMQFLSKGIVLVNKTTNNMWFQFLVHVSWQRNQYICV
jgi:hypothetical protein